MVFKRFNIGAYPENFCGGEGFSKKIFLVLLEVFRVVNSIFMMCFLKKYGQKTAKASSLVYFSCTSVQSVDPILMFDGLFDAKLMPLHSRALS